MQYKRLFLLFSWNRSFLWNRCVGIFPLWIWEHHWHYAQSEAYLGIKSPSLFYGRFGEIRISSLFISDNQSYNDIQWQEPPDVYPDTHAFFPPTRLIVRLSNMKHSCLCLFSSQILCELAQLSNYFVFKQYSEILSTTLERLSFQSLSVSCLLSVYHALGVTDIRILI